MTITMHGIIPESRSAKNSKGVKTYSQTYHLTTDSKTDDQYDIGSHPDLPVLGSTFASDADAYCIDVSPKCVSGYVHWNVTVEYSSERELAEDPTDDPALTEWDGDQYQRPLVVDEDGKVVCNSAGDLFDPPVMVDDSRLMSVTTKNLASIPTWIMNYSNAVNSDAFTLDGFSVAIGQAKMLRPKISKPQFRNGIAFRELTLSIQYRQ
jgi:hypothetical protein